MNDAAPGYLVEFVVIGSSVKVTAMDPATLREVSIIGSARLPKKLLAKQAVRKLEAMMRKEAAKP